MRLQGTVYTETLTTTSETDTVTLQATSGSIRGCTFFVSSDNVAGTAKLYYTTPAGAEKLIQSTAITAGATAEVLDFDFPIPECVLKWTGASTSSTTVFVEGITY
jgi:hypothetical protein